MSECVFNFSAGPAILPPEVIAAAREDLVSLDGTGIGILEHSHRGPAFTKVLEQTVADCRALAGIPPEYKVLFLQGGASTQFFQVPQNFLGRNQTADYILTGSWSKKAAAQAKRFGSVHIAGSSEDEQFTAIPEQVAFSKQPRYVHFTSNNTIFGTQWTGEPEIPEGTWLACDASSDIFSRPIDVTKYGIIYAGAQKNLGPSGATLVIIRDDLVESGADNIPEMLQYRIHAKDDSCYNTPPTFGIYMMGQVFRWLIDQGGLAAMADRNAAKAQKLYDYLDQSRMFRATARPGSRSLMNVTFVTGDGDLDAQFLAFAKQRRLDGLKGHRSVGGMRASIYNAFPPEGVDVLIAALDEFEQQHV